MRAVAVLLLLIWAWPAFAEPKSSASLLPDGVRLHLGSWHDRGDFDNSNFGLALCWPQGLVAGGYRNSYGNASWYTGLLGTLYEHHALRVEVMLGAVTGYSQTAPVLPVAVPVVGYRVFRRTSAQCIYMPGMVMPGGANVLHFMAEHRFGK